MDEETTLVGTDRRARMLSMALINSGLLVLLLALYYALAALLPLLGVADVLLAHGLSMVAVTVVSLPVRRRVAKVVDRVLRRDWRHAQELLRAVADELSRTIDPDELHRLLVDALPRRLRLHGATLWMLEPQDDRAFVAIGQDPALPGAVLLVNGASATQVSAARSYLKVPDGAQAAWAELLSAQAVRVAIPLRVGDRVVGIYGCAAPIDGPVYQQHVLDILLTLAPAVASAIENARAYTEIARLNTQLRALDQLKDEFIESVGHELRTPLTSLTLALQLLVHRPEMAHELAHVLASSVDRLQDLVDRVLRLDPDLHDATRHGLSIGPVELLPLLRDIVEEYGPAAGAKGLRLALDAPVGLAVWAHSGCLRRALHEVLDNAVRYSDQGVVTLAAELRDGLALVTISDQGRGIPEAERDHLFDAFYRGRGVRALAETPGAGLGLSLARRDVEVLDGRIWLERTGPEGSVMSVSLPAVPPTSGEPNAPDGQGHVVYHSHLPRAPEQQLFS
ncbi:MAG: hypothetical protein RLZZ387_2406 [Chloroflexota bacterium]